MNSYIRTFLNLKYQAVIKFITGIDSDGTVISARCCKPDFSLLCSITTVFIVCYLDMLFLLSPSGQGSLDNFNTDKRQATRQAHSDEAS